MATRQQFASSVSWNTITVVLQVVIQLAYTGLLARLISPDSFALMGIVLSIMGFAELFAQVGVGPALIQRKEIHQQHINGAFYTAVILGLAFTLLFVACAPLIASAYAIPSLQSIIQVVCFSFIISALAVVPRAMMMREMRFKVMFIASMISIIVGNVIVGLWLAYLGWNVWAYVWALFAQNALMTIVLWLFQPVKITRNWKWVNTRELMSYGLGSSLFNALNYIATKMDVLLIPLMGQSLSAVLHEEQLRKAAMYERSNYVMTQPITIMGKLSDSVLFSGMSRMQDENERLRKTILIATNLIACVVIPATVFVCFFSHDILMVWLGEKFSDAAPILQVLFAAVIFRTLSKLCDSLLRAKGAVYRGSWFKAIYVLLIAVGIFAAMPYGMTWVATAVVMATFIHYLMSMYLCTVLVAITWKQLFSALVPALQLGFITTMLSVLYVLVEEKINLPALVNLLLATGYVLGVVLLAVYNRPQLLGDKDLNPLFFLPEKIARHKYLRPMTDKLGWNNI
ncbi:MAG: lipopolysaccharide biosynthesis protein [Flavobacteriales bacterium]